MDKLAACHCTRGLYISKGRVARNQLYGEYALNDADPVQMHVFHGDTQCDSELIQGMIIVNLVNLEIALQPKV